MRILKGTYWLGRYVLAVPCWFGSGLFLGAAELTLWLARGARLGQMAFARIGNWLAYGEMVPDSVDQKIERRLDRLANWRGDK